MRRMKPALLVTAAVLTFGAGSLAAQRLTTISQADSQRASQQHPQVVAEFGGAMSGPLASYVQQVGRRVAGQSAVRGGANAYTITTLNSPVMNAFAVPGGYLYVTRQLIGLANDEAELAFVLGHEAGHVAANHSQKRQTRNVLSQLGAAVLGAATGSSGLGQIAGQLGQTLVLGYSRGQENESDTLGVRYLAAAGYDASASAGMLASLGAWDAVQSRVSGRDERAVPSWARTHPLSADRVSRVTRQAPTVQPSRTGERNRDRYLAAIDGMLFEDDPSQGVIEGERFLHPDLRFSFTAPSGYAIQNSSNAVSITGTAGQAQFGMGNLQGGLDQYVSGVFQSLAGSGSSQIRLPQPQRTSVNGIPAAYATARASTQQGQVDVTVFAYQWDQGRAYHFLMLTRAGTGLGPFGPTVNSLRRLSASEAAAIRPRVIDVVTVRSGDTIRSLAERMAYPSYRLERFLALNRLEANSRLAPGDKVKLVVYGARGA